MQSKQHQLDQSPTMDRRYTGFMAVSECDNGNALQDQTREAVTNSMDDYAHLSD